MCAGIVSRDIIRILLTHAAMHGTSTWVADIRNAYLQAPILEKHLIIFVEVNLVWRVLERRYWSPELFMVGSVLEETSGKYYLCCCMEFLGFKSSGADPGVWMRESGRNDIFTKYCEYMLLYTDDCLVICDRAETFLRNEIGNYFELKES